MQNEKKIKTIVPIDFENLKKYFSDKEVSFLIDYDNSTIKGEKFLTYLSNLDIPCDVIFDQNNENHLELLEYYFKTKNIVSINSLNEESLKVCLEYKKIENFNYSNFIEKNKIEIEKWCNVLQSLSLYNFYTTKSEKFKKFVEEHPLGNCSDVGLNFINLLSFEETSILYEITDKEKLFFYKEFFNEYMFKGKNLFYYWANENNNLFLITSSLCEEARKHAEKQKNEEKINVTSV